jgi:hypothetical protein
VGGAKAGILAYRQRTQKGSGRTTVSWHEDAGSAIRRHRELVYDASSTLETEEYYNPYKLRVDGTAAHTVAGATWIEAYAEHTTDFLLGGAMTTTAKSDRWTIEAVDVTVTVPAGTFSCIRIRHVGLSTMSDKTYWFARGVGKVKEVGGMVEELTSYSIP